MIGAALASDHRVYDRGRLCLRPAGSGTLR